MFIGKFICDIIGVVSGYIDVVVVGLVVVVYCLIAGTLGLKNTCKPAGFLLLRA